MRSAAAIARPLGRRAFLGALRALLVLPLPLLASGEAQAAGRPEVSLDRLVFPSDVPAARELEQHLRKALKREARRADWGADAGAKIEYRFTIEELSIRAEAKVLRIRCTAFGRLPKGKTARSQIEYGANPSRQ